MYSLIKKRTINQIIASRKSQRQKKEERGLRTISSSMQMELTGEFRIQAFLKKSSYNNEDKLVLLRYIEKKCRLRFDHAFSNAPINWVIVREKRIIERHFDSTKKSYYLLRGKISVCEKVHGGGGLRDTHSSLRESNEGEKVKKYEEIASIEGERGIGALFSPETYHRALLMSENSLILEIDHSNDELCLVERNCVMTNDEKEAFVKNFPLFKRLDNINKYYTPFFHVSKHSKGDLIYQIDAEAHSLYLIVEGEVEFQSKIAQQNPERSQDAAISRLILRNSWQNFILITTEILGKGNYFGEEEILQECTRKQNARCISLTCILVEVPLQKLHKLLFYNEFRDSLESSYLTKCSERSKKIDNFLAYRCPQSVEAPSQKKLQSIDFEEFNQAIFKACNEHQHEPRRLSLKDHRTKILHGSALKLNPTANNPKNDQFSMLEVNAQMYASSLKKFRSYSVEQKKRRKVKEKREPEGRSLRQIWRVLKLENVIQEDEKVGIENTEGKAYFNAHLRLAKHIKEVKSYRPKTISSNCRVKTEFVEYLHRAL